MFCLCQLLLEVQILFEDLQVKIWELYVCSTSCLWWAGQSIKPFFSNTEMCVCVMSVCDMRNGKFMLFWHSCVFASTFLHESVPQLGQPSQKNLDTPLGVWIIQSNQNIANTVCCVIWMSNTTNLVHPHCVGAAAGRFQGQFDGMRSSYEVRRMKVFWSAHFPQYIP